MARNESDREDLLREATALVERAEYLLPGEEEPVVAGFRRDGSFSLFFGGERVVQFNSAGQLRRGYFHGRLLKADQGKLVWMTRERTADAVILLSQPVVSAEAGDLLRQATELVERLSSHLQQGRFTLVGQVPAEGKIVERIIAWSANMPRPLQVAAAPNAR
ncbi:hypothetical protein ETAA8_05400 [Anatilimnocola aggregata]|uniref:Uncharacterized protein n=1 Tax=Anatilimnocola aggregata TaxID=2528021 RepID=A0A517Y5R6_9BACT|nr:hypothetical protein [Anatilimnocola aggregata]QDU25472.1 hypothetical protein ETAA8_05400 [Anatilimnocola aggregata]